eukprot:gene3596-2592_t
MARKRNQTKGKPEAASKTTTHDYGAPAANVDPDLTNYYSSSFSTLFNQYKSAGYDDATAYNAADTYATQYLNMYIQPGSLASLGRQSVMTQPSAMDMNGVPAPAKTAAVAAPAAALEAAPPAPTASTSLSASTTLRASLPVPPTSSGVTILPAAKRTLSGKPQDIKALDRLSYVEANRSCLQRELGVGIRVSEAAAQAAEITISAPSAYALAVARVELEALLHTADDDESPHPLRVKIEALKRENVHVFVDNSNVYLGAQTTSRRLTAVDSGGPPLSTNSNPRDLSVRLKVGALSRAVINSRCCQTRIVFGAKPSAGSFVWKKWQEAGFTVQAVDAGGLLFSMIDETIAQYAEQAHTLVLVTGDGNAYDGHGHAHGHGHGHRAASSSFVKSAEKALRHGWTVEVWAWRGCTSDKYRAMEQVHAADCGRFSLNYLDPFRAYITFQQPLGGVAGVVDDGTSATPDDETAEPRGSPSPPTRPTDGQRVPPVAKAVAVAVAVAVAAPTVDGDAEDEDEDEDEDGHRRRRRSDRVRCRTRWSQAQR